MTLRTLVAVASLAAAGSAFAFHCPTGMARIDAAFAKNPKLTDAQAAEVKKYRADGETPAGLVGAQAIAVQDAVRVLDDGAARGLAEHLRQSHVRQRRARTLRRRHDVAQHVARSHRRQLIAIAHHHWSLPCQNHGSVFQSRNTMKSGSSAP